MERFCVGEVAEINNGQRISVLDNVSRGNSVQGACKPDIKQHQVGFVLFEVFKGILTPVEDVQHLEMMLAKLVRDILRYQR